MARIVKTNIFRPQSSETAVAYFLRWRMRARIRRFLRPILRRPLPVFLTPTKAPFSLEKN
jgi:hypothetical protein